VTSGLPSAAGTFNPGSHPTSYRFSGSPRQIALIIREDSGGFRADGVQAGFAAGSWVREAMVGPLLDFPYVVRE
jgi:hypothetical protein